MPEPRRTVLVTDAGRGSALCVVRSLGRQGWRVVAADESSGAPAFASRHCAVRAVYPSPRAHPQAYAAHVEQLVAEHEVDLLLPITDEARIPLVRERERFERRCALAAPEAEALAIVDDKNRTLELAARHGIDVPRSVLVGSPRDLEQVDAAMRFPLVVKPVTSRRLDGRRIAAHSVSYAVDRQQLSAAVAEADGRYGVLVQEYCQGVGVGVEMVARRGVPLAIFQHERLAEVPATGGASALRKSVALDPALGAAATKLVAALEWTGPIMVEFKVGARTTLMEVNGRIWGSLPLASLAGVDFPAHWASLFGGAAAAGLGSADYLVGVRAYDPDLLLSWIANVLLQRRRVPGLPYPRRRAALRGLAAFLSPRCKSDYADAEDAAPARRQRRRMLRRALGRLRPVRAGGAR